MVTGALLGWVWSDNSVSSLALRGVQSAGDFPFIFWESVERRANQPRATLTSLSLDQVNSDAWKKMGSILTHPNNLRGS